MATGARQLTQEEIADSWCAQCGQILGHAVGCAWAPKPAPKVKIFSVPLGNGTRRTIVEFPDGTSEQAACFKGAIELFDLWRRVRALGQ